MGNLQPTFRDLIADNKSKSFWLVIGFCLFFAFVALVLALGVIAYSHPTGWSQVDWFEALAVGGIAGLVTLILSAIGYFAGDSIILAVHGAKPLRHADDPELVNVVEEMAIAAGIPVPEIYLIPDPAPNAFATGRDPQHAIVAITTGLRQKLSRDELQGVMAHEMSHIRNYDIRLMLLLAVLVGSIVMLCDLFWQIFRYGTSGKSSKSDGKGGLIAVVFIILAVILAMIAPILAQMIQLAVSRQREYLADASAVELTRYPLGLANALRKIAGDPVQLQTANRGTAHLYIVNPVEKFAAMADSPWASHPPIEDRIQRLEALMHQ